MYALVSKCIETPKAPQSQRTSRIRSCQRLTESHRTLCTTKSGAVPAPSRPMLLASETQTDTLLLGRPDDE